MEADRVEVDRCRMRRWRGLEVEVDEERDQ